MSLNLIYLLLHKKVLQPCINYVFLSTFHTRFGFNLLKMVIGIYPSVDESDRDRELSDDESTDDDVDDDCMLNDCLYIFIMSRLKLLFITKVICSIFIYKEQKM